MSFESGLVGRLRAEYQADFLSAILLFTASTVFFHLFSSFAEGEYGVADASIRAACKLDCGWYASIVDGGYHVQPLGHARADAANWAFFPLLPAIASVVAWLPGVDARLALVITSKIFLLGSIFAFSVAARREGVTDNSPLAGSLVAFNPYLVYAYAGYTETLYFFLTTLAFIAFRDRRWLAAGGVAALLSATRLVGVLLGPVLLLAYLQASTDFKWPSVRRLALALLLCPLGLAVFMLHLHAQTGDALAFMHVQVAWGRQIGNPIDVANTGLARGGWDRYFVICAAAGLAVGLWQLWRKKYAHGLFLIGAVLVPLSTGVPSLPRYLFWQYPLLLGLLELVLVHRLLTIVYAAFAAAFAGFFILSWFHGSPFVI